MLLDLTEPLVEESALPQVEEMVRERSGDDRLGLSNLSVLGVGLLVIMWL